MSSDKETKPEAPVSPPDWPVLSEHERRVLGVLVEKAKTTPDAYPMSLNALITGSNQKSNRDPLLNLADLEVEDALLSAQKKHLVIKIVGGRVERWRHQLYESWRVNKVDIAILGELLLRGPQTEGELRSRASRMEPIEDLDALRPVLKNLAERRLVVYLSPEGRRGTMLTHGFHSKGELERLRALHRAGAPETTMEAVTRAPEAPSTRPPLAPVLAPVLDNRVPALETKLSEANMEIAALRERVANLEATVTGLAEQVKVLKESLGG